MGFAENSTKCPFCRVQQTEVIEWVPFWTSPDVSKPLCRVSCKQKRGHAIKSNDMLQLLFHVSFPIFVIFCTFSVFCLFQQPQTLPWSFLACSGRGPSQVRNALLHLTLCSEGRGTLQSHFDSLWDARCQRRAGYLHVQYFCRRENFHFSNFRFPYHCVTFQPRSCFILSHWSTQLNTESTLGVGWKPTMPLPGWT